MTRENFDSAIKAMSSREPFHPFTVALIGGRRFEIDHVHALACRTGQAVFVSPGNIPILFDHDSVVAIVADIAGASA